MKAIRRITNTIVGACLVMGSIAVAAQEPGTRRDPGIAGITAAKGVSVAVWATNLGGPRGLLADRAGGLWVAEESAGRVVKVGPQGRITKLAEGLRAPHDVEVDARGNVYVAETPTGKVLVISPTGALTTYVDGLGGPVDLAFSPDGELVVCEYSSGRVVAFKSPEEKRVLLSGLKPHGLAFDKAGATYVNDISGGRLVKVMRAGKVEQVASGLAVPIGIAIGPSGDLYVAEKRGKRLLRINPGGKVDMVLQGLTTPRDPVFDNHGNLYVAETDAGRILKVSGDF